MANYAALIDSLTVSGSRKSDGTANASGKVYFYTPGTLTTVNVYANADASTIVTQPVTLDNGGRVPRSNYPDGIFVTQPVRLLIQDSAGTIVSDSVFEPSTAGATGVNNTGFTDTTLDAALTKAFTSFGGQDWQYKESGGATARTIKSKFSEIWISVKDFGAVGDGVAIDTTAIQAAMNRAKSLVNSSTNLGSVAVWFPAGNYLIDQALTLSSARVNIRGESSGGTQIITSHSTANAFTFTTCQTFEVSGMRIRCSGNNSGSGIKLTDCSSVYLADLLLDDNGSALFLTPINVSRSAGISSGITIDRCAITCQDGASGRAVKLSDTSIVNVLNSVFNAGVTGTAIELAGTTNSVEIYSNYFTGSATGIVWTSGVTGTKVRVFGNPTLGTAGYTTVFDLSAMSTLPDFRQWGNNVDTVSFSGATGTSLTPVLYKGKEILLTASSGGAGTVTVNAPAVLPGTTATDVDLYWDFVFKNSATGAVTWSLNAVFVVSAAVPTTDAHTIAVRFRWDKTTSKLRECSRADTVT